MPSVGSSWGLEIVLKSLQFS
uniref:Uncharacterized protein n=1 Tax=Rhizophora mucronata TaxID=61149 RepID=A0A2P2NTL5_RHIMU